jgi:hypothetical protein
MTFRRGAALPEANKEMGRQPVRKGRAFPHSRAAEPLRLRTHGKRWRPHENVETPGAGLKPRPSLFVMRNPG